MFLASRERNLLSNDHRLKSERAGLRKLNEIDSQPTNDIRRHGDMMNSNNGHRLPQFNGGNRTGASTVFALLRIRAAIVLKCMGREVLVPRLLVNSLAIAALFLELCFAGPELNAADSTMPRVDASPVFDEVDGIVAVEAEHFVSQDKTDVRAWYRVEDNQIPAIKPDGDEPHWMGSSGACYLEALPDTRVTHDDKITDGENFFSKPGQAGVLTYRVHVSHPGRYYVWVRHLSTGTEDNGLHVGLDDKWPESGQRWQTTKKREWAWESRQRTEQLHTGVRYKLFLDIAEAGEHRIHFSIREDGFEFDKFVLASNRDYEPEGLGPGPVLKSGVATAPATLSKRSSTAPIARDRPNVLFILTEDQGAHLSLLGTPGLQTPHIDALAKSGVYFNNAFVAYPVCSASKAAIYTGLHNHTNGILNNTHNFHKPADQVTAAEQGLRLAKTNRIRDGFRTLTEILQANGYYQGVTHKLHVLPNEKFPYDAFLRGKRGELERFIDQAKQREQPWFLMVNIPNSHRPYPNSDKQGIRVRAEEIQLPSYLPDSPEIRKDWAEYLSGIEEADALTGEALEVLEQSGESDNTLVIFMSDHGPTFQHGKMTMYDLGLRVPFIVRGPGVSRGVTNNALVSALDLLPTIIEMCTIDQAFEYPLHGKSIKELLQIGPHAKGHEYIFAEISNLGPLPNDGIQERSVFDGRWKLIYRENVEAAWRQVNADSREFKIWGNRTYAETIRLKDQFPMQYRILAEMDPQNLGASVPALELYDLEIDPDEIRNLATNTHFAQQRDRLLDALRDWVKSTNDEAVSP